MTIRHVIIEQLLEIRMKSRHSHLYYRAQERGRIGSVSAWAKTMFDRPVLCHGDDEGDRVVDVAAARQADSSLF